MKMKRDVRWGGLHRLKGWGGRATLTSSYLSLFDDARAVLELPAWASALLFPIRSLENFTRSPVSLPLLVCLFAALERCSRWDLQRVARPLHSLEPVAPSLQRIEDVALCSFMNDGDQTCLTMIGAESEEKREGEKRTSHLVPD